MDQGDRLREERVRLGLSQTRFAALAGASKHTQINWEKGSSSPTATALQAWHHEGLDVFYVVTGGRVEKNQPNPFENPESVLLLRQVITDLNRIIHMQHLELDADAQARAISSAFAVALRYRLEQEHNGDIEPLVTSALLAVI